jgi:heptaprenyl diphosphate synthase
VTANPAVLTWSDTALAEDLARRLEAVESRLREITSSSDPLLDLSARHLAEAGGKRVRPMLTLLAAQLGDPDRPQVVDAAVVVELTHLATLYHDDVMDEADVRRGAASANTRWTNTIAILTGDYLFARASDLTASLGTEATHIQSRTFARLVEGQIAETAGPRDEDPVEHHLRVIADKTASLISTSARLGAMLAGAPADDVDTVARFGELYGVAFQLSDDLIDIASDEASLGKTPGTDLREGIRTLPVLLVLAQDDAASARLRELLSGELSGDDQLAEALELLRDHPAMDQARARLTSYVDEARAMAGKLPEGATRDALLTLSDYVLARTG